jgi:hypothetical protein
MKSIRAGAVVVLLVALGVAATRVSSTSRAFPVAAPCSADALAEPYSGPLKVQSVQSFGCVGQWAYLWATVGKGIQEIGVTEVLHYNATSLAWRNASRLTYCDHHRLPTYVEYWGCNSN